MTSETGSTTGPIPAELISLAHPWPASPAGRCDALGMHLDSHGPRTAVLRIGEHRLTRGDAQQLRTATPDALTDPGTVALGSLHPDTISPGSGPAILALTSPGDLIVVTGPATTPEATAHARTLDATLPRLILHKWEAHPTPTGARP